MTDPERVYLKGSVNEGKRLVPTKCAVCNSCWRTPGSPRCVNGGPYLGYIEVSYPDG